MLAMNDQNLARLEASLERLIEGAFAQMFSKSVRAQDLALQLARALEMHAEPATGSDPRPLAPDEYVISMNAADYAILLEREPNIAKLLSQHLVELAVDAGYRLSALPTIRLEPDPLLGSGKLAVSADHSSGAGHSTAIMQRVDLPAITRQSGPRNAQLIVNGERTIFVTDAIVNLGRSRDNHVVLDDPFISRHHAQMRLRFGRYTLFDAQSQSGTFVNDVRVREHPLQTGDVIRMGKIQIVYLEDDPSGESQTNIQLPSDLS